MSIFDANVLRTSPLSTRFVAAVFALFALGVATLQVQVQARTPAQPPVIAQSPSTSDQAFDVASIRRNKDEEERRAVILQRDPNAPIPPGRAQTLPGANFLGRGMTVRELIRDAYGYRNRPAADVVGGPKWIDAERYDVRAKASVQFPLSTTFGLPPAAEAALRALLAERMHLRVRLESRRQRVYELVMAHDDRRLGSGLTPAKGGCRSMYAREAITPLLVQQGSPADAPPPVRPCMVGISIAGVLVENMTMEEWARFLAAFPQINANVVDHTGLKGAYDIKLTNPEAAESQATTLLPPVQPALESQLGLKLRPTEALVDVLVIESVERPTDN
jgi:uncharacterized protein (TIGR03435 family)